MVKPEWGRKRTCQNCGTRFYDMKRTPITCPKCGAGYEPEGAGRPRRAPAPEKPARAPEPVVEPPVIEVEVEEEETLVPPEEEETEAGDAEPEEDAMMEDPADLGEDENDITEVMDHVEPTDDNGRRNP